jgi:hypothetical protein
VPGRLRAKACGHGVSRSSSAQGDRDQISAYNVRETHLIEITEQALSIVNPMAFRDRRRYRDWAYCLPAPLDLREVQAERISQPTESAFPARPCGVVTCVIAAMIRKLADKLSGRMALGVKEPAPVIAIRCVIPHGSTQTGYRPLILRFGGLLGFTSGDYLSFAFSFVLCLAKGVKVYVKSPQTGQPLEVLRIAE